MGDPARSWPERAPVDADRARVLLREGEVEILGRMPWSSNGTYLVSLHGDGDELLAIYKPREQERPLWDFSQGTLHRREVAACVISDALGWEIVPDTVVRDGPFGDGSMQRFVLHDPEEHFFTLRADHGDDCRRFAIFDIVANNTDRKGGHCLVDADGHVWGIDHGVTFHHHFKLRTVIWDYAGEALGDDDLGALTRLARDLGGDVGARLCDLLDPHEVAAALARIEDLCELGELPGHDGEYYNFPWPTV